MKRAILTLILMGIVGAAQAGPFGTFYSQSLNIGTTNVLILPSCTPTATNYWVAGTAYARGAIIIDSNVADRAYWATTAGTSTNTIPTFSTTNDVADGPTLTWRMVNRTRSRYQIINLSSADLWLGFGRQAASQKGAPAFSDGGGFDDGFGSPGCYQGAIYGIMESGNGTVTVQEW